MNSAALWLRGVLPHGVEPTDLGEWSWEPSIIAGTAIFTASYLLAMGPLRSRFKGATSAQPRQVFLFLLGTAIFFLALTSPLEVLSDDFLFSAHMVQHILITTIAPPLWLLGTPGWLLSPLVRSPLLLKAGRALTRPIPAFLLFNVVFWLWHWPSLYDFAVERQPAHVVQHLTFIVAAVVNWWPVLGPLPEIPRLRDPARALYVFASCQPGVALGAILFFSRDVLYQAYLDAPRVFDLTPLADQQLGGLIMWVPGNAVYLLVLTVVFISWISRTERSENDSRPEVR